MKLRLRIGTLTYDDAFVRIFDEGGHAGEALLPREVLHALTAPLNGIEEGDYLSVEVKLLSRSKATGQRIDPVTIVDAPALTRAQREALELLAREDRPVLGWKRATRRYPNPRVNYRAALACEALGFVRAHLGALGTGHTDSYSITEEGRRALA